MFLLLFCDLVRFTRCKVLRLDWVVGLFVLPKDSTMANLKRVAFFSSWFRGGSSTSIRGTLLEAAPK